MRGAGPRGIGALLVASLAAACGWPEYAFDSSKGGDGQGGMSGAGVSTGGSPSVGGSAGQSGNSGHGGSAGSGASACDNELLDPPETGVDCGGGTCPPCDPGSPCTVDVDCAHPVCTLQGMCERASCADDEANGTETDKDCGGPDCVKRCKPGDDCRDDSDCESELCQDGQCVPSDCDPAAGSCGTSDCLCANGRDCAKHEDCASGNCGGGTCTEGARVFSRNDEPRAEDGATPAILVAFLVRNEGPTRLPAGEVSLRFFFASDGATDQQARCDASRTVPTGICDEIMTPLFSVSPGGPFVDSYVEVRFRDRELGPGTQTSEIAVAIEPSGDESYDQSNDYSFAANQNFAVNTRVTLYRRGVLIWGTEPPAAAGTTTTH
jgi:hypothetical protein